MTHLGIDLSLWRLADSSRRGGTPLPPLGVWSGSWRRYERALVERLLPQFQRDMLVMADRGSFSYTLWKQAAATGADLL